MKPRRPAGPAAKAGGSAWAMLAVATIAQAATGFVFLGVPALGGFVKDDLGLSGAETGLLVTAVGTAPLFALLPVGRMLDLYGERRVVGAGALWLGVGVALAALSPSYPALLAVLFVGGAGYATSQPGGSKAVASWFRRERRGLAMGIRQTGLPLGGVFAAAILPHLAEARGWRWAMASTAAVGVTGGLAFAAMYKPPFESEPSEGYAVRGALTRLARQPGLRPALWSGLVMVSAQFCVLSYLMLFLRDAVGFSLTDAAAPLLATQVAGIGGRILLALWSDRFNDRLVAVAVAAAASVPLMAGLALLRGQPSAMFVVILASIMGFFVFGWYGPWVAHVAELGPPGSVGLTLTFAMTANQLAIAGAPPLFGLFVDLSGGYAPAWWALAAALGALASGLGARLLRR